MEHKKVLIAEDDKDITEILSLYLEKNNFEIYIADNGKKALNIVQTKKIDIALVDIMMPIMNGYELIKEIRKNYLMPIIVESAKITPEDKIGVLKMGADDFISKPFDINEVLARVEAQLRRYKAFSSSKTNSNNKLTHKNLTLDIDSRQVQVNGININLTVREFDILELLISNPNKVFTRVNLFEAVWKDEFIGDYNTVNVHISNLRAKISKIDKENEYIQTVWGIGFKLKSE